MVRGLADGDARALLDSAVTGPLDERVRDRIVAETRGNPRALLEVARGLTPGDLAGGFGLPGAAAPPDRTEERFGRRLAPLPPATRLLLLVAAAEPIRRPGAGVAGGRSARRRGRGRGTGRRGRAHRVRRADTVLSSAGPVRGLPRGLAGGAPGASTGPWPRPPTPTPIPIAAPGIVRTPRPGSTKAWPPNSSARPSRARARGGLAAAAAFRERAAELTPEPARRAQRALAAAQAKHQAGAPEAALRLLAMAQAGPLDELGRARAELLRAQMAADAGRGHGAPSLLKAAKRLEPLHPGLARETYRDAFGAALTAGRLAISGGIPEVGRGRAGRAAGTAAAAWPRSAAGRAGGADHQGMPRARRC